MSAADSAVLEESASPGGGSISATLPIEGGDGLSLDRAKARELGLRLSAQYSAAQPFPHVVIDDFLPIGLAEAILANFPTGSVTSDVTYKDKVFEFRKRQIQPEDCCSFVRQVFGLFNSAAILEFLEALTRIEGLLPDPYFNGGGFHEISRGGRLGLHADFRINGKLWLHRRLNLLIYLNKSWKDEYGGHFEMWDRSVKRKVHSVAPLFNRCVIFNTDRDSWHGHPAPLNTPDDVTRKSMALYYYTASQKIYEEIPRHGTVFRQSPDDPFSARILLKQFRAYVTASELLPPVLYRRLKLAKARLKGRAPKDIGR